MGGERGGVLIPGFDLDNSPLSYTRERVQGKTIIFTTSNGTAALLHAKNAAEILVGSFANVTAICQRVANDPRPVHILCAGTRALAPSSASSSPPLETMTKMTPAMATVPPATRRPVAMLARVRAVSASD